MREVADERSGQGAVEWRFSATGTSALEAPLVVLVQNGPHAGEEVTVVREVGPGVFVAATREGEPVMLPGWYIRSVLRRSGVAVVPWERLPRGLYLEFMDGEDVGNAEEPGGFPQVMFSPIEYLLDKQPGHVTISYVAVGQ